MGMLVLLVFSDTSLMEVGREAQVDLMDFLCSLLSLWFFSSLFPFAFMWLALNRSIREFKWMYTERKALQNQCDFKKVRLKCVFLLLTIGVCVFQFLVPGIL